MKAVIIGERFKPGDRALLINTDTSKDEPIRVYTMLQFMEQRKQAGELSKEKYDLWKNERDPLLL